MENMVYIPSEEGNFSVRMLPDFNLLQIPETVDNPTDKSLLGSSPKDSSVCTISTGVSKTEPQKWSFPPSTLKSDLTVETQNLLSQAYSVLSPDSMPLSREGSFTSCSSPEWKDTEKASEMATSMSENVEPNFTGSEDFFDFTTLEQLTGFKHDTAQLPELSQTDSLEDFLNMESDYDLKNNTINTPTSVSVESTLKIIPVDTNNDVGVPQYPCVTPDNPVEMPENLDEAQENPDDISDNPEEPGQDKSEKDDYDWSVPPKKPQKRKRRQVIPTELQEYKVHTFIVLRTISTKMF